MSIWFSFENDKTTLIIIKQNKNLTQEVGFINKKKGQHNANLLSIQNFYINSLPGH